MLHLFSIYSVYTTVSISIIDDNMNVLSKALYNFYICVEHANLNGKSVLAPPKINDLLSSCKCSQL